MVVILFAFRIANGQRWNELYLKSNESLDAGEIKKSTSYLELALPLAEKELENGSTEAFLAISNDLAVNYMFSGHFNLAVDLFKKYLNHAPPSSAAFAKSNLGLAYTQLARYDSARKMIEESLNSLRTITGTTHPEYLNALNNLATVYFRQGEYQTAERIYKQGMVQLLNSQARESADLALWQNNLALLYDNLARYTDALEFYQKSLDLYEKLGATPAQRGYVYNNLGRLYSNLGQFDSADFYFMKARRGIRKGDSQYPVLINNLGTSNFQLGNWQKADEYYHESLSLKEALYGDSHPTIAITLKNIAGLKTSLSNYEEAINYLEQAIEIENKSLGAGHPAAIGSKQQLAGILVETEKYERAEALLLECQEEFTREYMKSHPVYSDILFDLALLKLKSGDLGEAEKLAQESYRVIQSMISLDRLRMAKSKAILSDIRHRQKLYGSSILERNETLELIRSSVGPEHPLLAEQYQKLAITYAAMQDPVKAHEAFRNALNNYIDQINHSFPFLVESEKIIFYNSLSEHFEQFNEFANIFGMNNPEINSDLYNYQLATKAILLNATSKWKSRIRNSADINLIRRFADWQIKNEQLHELKSIDQSELMRRGIDLKEFKSQVEEEEKQLLQRSSLFSRLTEKPVHWQDVQRMLDDSEAAIEILNFRSFDFENREFSAESNYAALLISSETKNHPQFVSIPNGDDLENKWLKQYRNSIRFKLNDPDSYKYFWLPIKSVVAPYGKVYLSPDGVFNQINLNTLFNEVDSTYLIDELGVQIVTNTRDLLDRNDEDNFNNFAILLGNPDFDMTLSPPNDQRVLSSTAVKLDPLPGTEDEIAELQILLEDNDWEVQVLVENEATEENLKNAFKPKLMHIATHGFFREEIEDNKNVIINPLINSGLMMAGAENHLQKVYVGINGQREDGLLTAAEALTLNIDNTELVVLSACETGLGEIRNGQGVYGLQRSFNIAGAKSLVMSLWKVDDQSTRKLMSSFYEKWFNGQTKEQAFKEAQIELRRDYPEPYYWGAFVMVGK